MDSQMPNVVRKSTCDKQAAKCIDSPVNVNTACACCCAVLYYIAS